MYDFSAPKHINVDGTVQASHVDVYDYELWCHFGGSGNNGIFELYDYGGSHHIELKIQGASFEGYHYGASCHFSGNVNGNDISLFDYRSGSHFNYNI